MTDAEASVLPIGTPVFTWGVVGWVSATFEGLHPDGYVHVRLDSCPRRTFLNVAQHVRTAEEHALLALTQ